MVKEFNNKLIKVTRTRVIKVKPIVVCKAYELYLQTCMLYLNLYICILKDSYYTVENGALNEDIGRSYKANIKASSAIIKN